MRIKLDNDTVIEVQNLKFEIGQIEDENNEDELIDALFIGEEVVGANNKPFTNNIVFIEKDGSLELAALKEMLMKQALADGFIDLTNYIV